jgi:tRNA(Arg) A34 adenosine deaminase TadA
LTPFKTGDLVTIETTSQPVIGGANIGTRDSQIAGFHEFFRTIRGGSHLETVRIGSGPRETFVTVDYSLQLSQGIRNFYQYVRTHPAAFVADGARLSSHPPLAERPARRLMEYKCEREDAVDELFKSERDCIVATGLIAATYLDFDPEIVHGNSSSHSRGFNVCCMIVDNVDGEVLACGQSHIHSTVNPLQHAEQIVVHEAIERIRTKRPRPVNMSVEEYYKTRMFMAPGINPSAIAHTGCTLYNTFDPCGMCAVTLLACYMKRIAYAFEDVKFAEVYQLMRKFFKGRESVKEPIELEPLLDFYCGNQRSKNRFTHYSMKLVAGTPFFVDSARTTSRKRSTVVAPAAQRLPTV